MIRWGFAVLLALGTAAHAQNPAAPACELHVWPAAALSAVTQGTWLNQTVNQVYDPAKGGIAKPDIDQPAVQIGLMRDLALDQMFALPGAKLVFHEQALPRTAVTFAAPRHADSDAACYAELVILRLIYDDAPLAGRSLKIMASWRRFDAGPPRMFTGWASRQLQLYDAVTVRPRPPGGEAELREAFVADITQFAAQAVRGAQSR